MNNMLPRPRFWAEAAAQIQTRRSLFGELMIYLLLTLLAYVGQALLISIPVSGWLVQSRSDSILEALEGGQSIQGVILGLMEELPDWVTVISLVSGVAMGVEAVRWSPVLSECSLPAGTALSSEATSPSHQAATSGEHIETGPLPSMGIAYYFVSSAVKSILWSQK